MPLADRSIIWNVDIRFKEKKRGSKAQWIPHKCFMYSHTGYGTFANICLVQTGEVKVVYLSELYDDEGRNAREKLGYSLAKNSYKNTFTNKPSNQIEFGLAAIEDEEE